MKRKYMGLAKSFYKGYSELHDKDFFELDGQDINSLNLADRANLHFKLCSILPVSFSSTEKSIIDLIQNAETFTDTIIAAEALYNFCKQESEKEETLENQQQAKLDFEQDLESFGDLSTGSTDDSSTSILDTDSSSPVEDRSDSTLSNDRVVDSDPSLEPEVHTADALDSKLKDLINDEHVVENVYGNSKLVDDIIVSNEEVHKEIDNDWIEQNKKWEESSLPMNLKFDEVDSDYVQFKEILKKKSVTLSKSLSVGNRWCLCSFFYSRTVLIQRSADISIQ